MRKYEIALIFDPSLDEKGIDDELSKITTLIEKQNSKVDEVDKWGIKKLAYPIKNQENGFYCFLYFSGEDELIEELNRVSNINDKLLRHLIINREK